MKYVSEKQEQSFTDRVTRLIESAVIKEASDIHLEPTENVLRVRFRVDGMLYDYNTVAKEDMTQFLACVKVMAHINIAEKRIPQDGKMRVLVSDHAIDLRVSTFPGLYGEKIVIRILDRAKHMIAINQLGFSPEMLATISCLIKNSNGFFLVTGPTGSGKTTTLYAILSELHSPDKNITTLEDPVEYNLEGITQGQVNPDAGFTFEKGIRALLRQDPDVLMVGEIRDKQTARVAIEAALTGHMVLSTLHTNDAPSAFMRLMDMSIEPYLLNASLCGVLAQRLVRKLCSDCKVVYTPSLQEQEICEAVGLSGVTLYEGAGCETCDHIGYKGRIGIFELMSITDDMRARIVKEPVVEAIYEQALADGMYTLLQDGVQKVKDGTISLQELLRTIIV